MSEEQAKERQRRRDECIERILDLALDLTLERLENVDPKEKKDNMAFDRVARTAQVLIRVADDADSIAARKRKEQQANDQSGDNADEEARLDREAEVLQQRLDKYIDGFARGDAPLHCGGDESQTTPRGRNGA
ncbi:MAG: hypothetical protein KDE05_15670 [Parvularculaceae bacterium]|nr:hypothetical protein [Parvularculaceae bacterium]